MCNIDDVEFQDIEKPAGPPDLPAADVDQIDARRRRAYESFEAFFRSTLAALDRERPGRWRRDYSSAAAYEGSVAPMRDRLKQMLGFWIQPQDREPVERADVRSVWQDEGVEIRRFWFDVQPGLRTYALELIPRTPPPHPGLLVQHGYGASPELACGLSAEANLEDGSYRSLGLRAARHGYHVVSVHHPAGYGEATEHANCVPMADLAPGARNGQNRLHRLATLAGGSLFGLFMLASSRGVDVLATTAGVDADRIGMYGLSQGGQSALYLPALDTRIRATVASAYFNHRLPKLTGPYPRVCYLDWQAEDQFFHDQTAWFSDCDVTSLIAPRAFAVEAGLHDGAVDFAHARAEFQRARVHYDRLGLSDRIEFIPHAEGHVSATARAFEFLAEQFRQA